MQLKGIPYIEILKSKLFIAVAIIPLLFGLLEYIYFLSIGSLTVFPNNDYLLDYFTDSSIGGNSQIIKNEVTDSGLMLDFVLDKTTSSPYVGIKISRKDNKTFNIAKYDQLKINTNGNHVDKIGVAIFTSMMQIHVPESNPAGAPTDSVSYNSGIMATWNGRDGWYLEQIISGNDSVVIDQVGGVFDDNGRNFGTAYDVAGVTGATGNSILVRKFSVKQGNFKSNC